MNRLTLRRPEANPMDFRSAVAVIVLLLMVTVIVQAVLPSGHWPGYATWHSNVVMVLLVAVLRHGRQAAPRGAVADGHDETGARRDVEEHAEIVEVMRASHWQDYASGEEIVKEGEMDERFYVVVSGTWTNTATAATSAGAATWGNGATGTTGVVAAGNSTVGAAAGAPAASGRTA